MKTASYSFAACLIAAVVAFYPEYSPAKDAEEQDSRQEVRFMVPVGDILSMESGTVEVQFMLDYSFDETLRPEIYCFQPFVFIYIYDRKNPSNKQDDYRPNISISMTQIMSQEGGGQKDCIQFSCNWFGVGFSKYEDKEKGPWFKKGELHSLAATWEQKDGKSEWEFFIDGESSFKESYPAKNAKVRGLGKDELIFLGGPGGMSPATILAYRISSKARGKGEIKSMKPLKEDKETTFFLDAKTAGKYKREDWDAWTKMALVGTIDIDKGTFFGKYRIVDTPKGKGIQFFDKKSK